MICTWLRIVQLCTWVCQVVDVPADRTWHICSGFSIESILFVFNSTGFSCLTNGCSWLLQFDSQKICLQSQKAFWSAGAAPWTGQGVAQSSSLWVMSFLQQLWHLLTLTGDGPSIYLFKVSLTSLQAPNIKDFILEIDCAESSNLIFANIKRQYAVWLPTLHSADQAFLLLSLCYI